MIRCITDGLKAAGHAWEAAIVLFVKVLCAPAIHRQDYVFDVEGTPVPTVDLISMSLLSISS